MQIEHPATAKLPIDTVLVTIGGEPLIYKGLCYPRATIDFKGLIPEPLWDNEDKDGRKFPVLQKPFCSFQDVIDLSSFHKLAAVPLPKMPQTTFQALTTISTQYFGGPKSVLGYQFHFDASLFRRELRYMTPQDLLHGIVKTIMHHCADRISKFEIKIKDTTAA